MQAGITAAKSLSKAVYFFSVSPVDGKVAHLNSVPKSEIVKDGFNAKTWFNKVSEIVGGKVKPSSLFSSPFSRLSDERS